MFIHHGMEDKIFDYLLNSDSPKDPEEPQPYIVPEELQLYTVWKVFKMPGRFPLLDVCPPKESRSYRIYGAF